MIVHELYDHVLLEIMCCLFSMFYVLQVVHSWTKENVGALFILI
jgi:hypothetical protein